jgi:hypothetical protein
MRSLIGKRILVFWTTEAFNAGNDWPSFRVIDASDDFLWCEGVESPCGVKHDGSKVAIKVEETNDIIEWKNQ